VIVAGMSADAAAQVSAVDSDRSDAVVFAGGYSGLNRLAESRAIAFADASRVHAGPAPTNSYLFVNVGERPFDDPQVRQALNFAIDRRRVLELAGGSSLNALSCQILPPGLPGFTPACPYTRDVTAGGGWTGPDLPRARRLVAASGTRGQRVEVFGPPKFAPIVRYAREVLERLGYRARVRVISPVDDYYAYINDLRHHAQVMFFNWYDEFPTASSFFESLSCAVLVPASASNLNPAQFCDHGLDAGVTDALAARGADANTRWAALDQRLLAAAPAVPLFSRRMLLLVSDRVGNAQLHQTIGPLLDQFWVR
jgi:peptide/nickel transport system substrate-binding protein